MGACGPAGKGKKNKLREKTSLHRRAHATRDCLSLRRTAAKREPIMAAPEDAAVFPISKPSVPAAAAEAGGQQHRASARPRRVSIAVGRSDDEATAAMWRWARAKLLRPDEEITLVKVEGGSKRGSKAHVPPGLVRRTIVVSICRCQQTCQVLCCSAWCLGWRFAHLIC